jgi:hypothetical protein
MTKHLAGGAYLELWDIGALGLRASGVSPSSHFIFLNVELENLRTDPSSELQGSRTSGFGRMSLEHGTELLRASLLKFSGASDFRGSDNNILPYPGC